jgi:hypothetical protein
MNKILVPLLAFVISAPALAIEFQLPANFEVHIGNGGDVLHCPQTNRMELLDYYEAKTIRGIDIQLGPDGASINEHIAIALSRLMALDPKRSEKWRKYSESFFDDALFLENVILTDVNDSAHIALPDDPDCGIEQIAIQKPPMFPEDHRYTVSQKLWDKLWC